MTKIRYELICPHCGEPAYYTLKRPQAGDLLVSKDWFYTSGDQCQSGAVLHCDKCSRLLSWTVFNSGNMREVQYDSNDE